MPAPRKPSRQHHVIPVALALAVAMLSYFAHLVNQAVQRGGEHRTPVTSNSKTTEADTIAFAPHTFMPRP